MDSQVIEKIKKFRDKLFTKIAKEKNKSVVSKMRFAVFVLDDLLEELTLKKGIYRPIQKDNKAF